MDSNICYNCGSPLNGYRCPNCGAIMTEAASPKEQKMLSSAFLLLRESHFDEAKVAFEAILKKYPENALAYWGRFCSRYHITYVLGANDKFVPKCPTESGANVFEDTDYLKATEYANDEEKDFLQAQAERIKAFCTERTFSKNRVVRFTLGEVDPNDAFVMPPKSKKPLILSAVLAFMLIAATSVCFATGVFHKHEPGMAATCTRNQICIKCNEILAFALGHTPGAEANCTDAQWSAISFGSYWNTNTGDYTVTCTDGTVDKDGTVTYH